MFLNGSGLGLCFNTKGLSGLHYVKVLSGKEERASRTLSTVSRSFRERRCGIGYLIIWDLD